MSSALLLLLAVATSLVAVLIAPGRGGRQALRDAARHTLELVGIAALFLVGNLTLGVVIVLAIRSVLPLFVSIYVLDDVSLVALSLLQGTVFFFWRRGSSG